ncbi:AfsR/SARP family transcriptional regulator [Dactylosporangium matsuzakiense]|uniref:AfsR/SARP family transcriptional regulator n=1 Tax=Dactylosporangium matsuzakiense TaxID=53360 RepID=UPI0021C270BF|nr:BTAD domain-containing putative transcriptional regulator [Dactylosporangium matsuzakiense]UWZ42106.1 tetratricopeptide repeat protein [Dactylosporangium matsuzakiense]
MRVGLLGPAEIVDGGSRVALGGRKPSILMAVLACAANRPVPGAELCAALWGTPVPAKAEQNLRVWVHHLRRAVGSSRIDRRGDGYVLTLGPDELDITAFRTLTEQGRAAAGAGAAQQASGLFGAALDLWRGPALAGLETVPVLGAEAARLEEERLQVLEQRFAADLALGRHAAIVAELRSLTARHPIRETFHGQLMEALAGAGRAAEAIAVYGALREVLADELGADPGRPLQDLHLALLRNRPAAARPPAAAALPVAVPRQLPAAVTGFVGRAAWLARLDALLPDGSPATPIAAVSGPGGIGKTTLAVHWAHRVQDRFPDGQLYVNLRGFDPTAAPADPADVLRDCLEALGVPGSAVPDRFEARSALYRTTLADRRVLVVLDNARDADHVRPLLPGSRHCLTLVTSRDQLTGLVAEGGRALPLDAFSAAEARALLAHRLDAGRAADADAATGRIVERCAGLPLALTIVTARLATNPHLSLEAVADELARSRRRLDPFTGGDVVTDVRAVFSWSYRIVSPGAARLFRFMGLLHVGPDIGLAAAAALLELSPQDARPLLTQLVRGHLIGERPGDRYAFHDLLRAYAAELAAATDSPADREAALHRLLDYYLYSARAAAVALEHSGADAVPDEPAERFADHRAAVAWLTAERPALVAAVGRAHDGGRPEHCRRLARIIQDFLAAQGHWHDLRRVQQIALSSATGADDPAAQIIARRSLAYAETLLGHHDRAEIHLRFALEQIHRLGDPVQEAYCIHNLAIVKQSQAHYPQALDLERQALERFRRLGHPRGEAAVLNTIACLHAALGEPELALEFGQQALAVHRTSDSWRRDPAFLDTIADAYRQLGQYQAAQEHYREALGLARDVGNRYLEAAILAQLGDTHHAAGEPGPAGGAWREAAELIADLDQLPTVSPVNDFHTKVPDLATLYAKLGA